MKKTTRKPGKIDREEVKRFQRTYGLKVDGKFGDQSMGQLAEMNTALNRVTAGNTDLRVEQKSRAAAGSVVAVVIGLLFAALIYCVALIYWMPSQ